MSDSILQIRGVSVEFKQAGGVIRAVDDVSLDVPRKTTVALVGESGCGKTTLARAVLGLQPTVSGEIFINGEKVQGVSPRNAERVGMVWQDPFASLNPRWSMGRSAAEPARLMGKDVDIDSLFKEVGLDPSFVERYPHQLSGGQRQRVAMARALSSRPPLIICDEPTAALDLSIRAQILNLLKHLQQAEDCSFLYISHDLATVRYLADRVAVMYMGQIVEEAPTEELFTSPKHPYTKLLIESAPSLDRLLQLPAAPEGEIPDPRTRFEGCRFVGRCPQKLDKCRTQPPLESSEGMRRYRCWNPHNGA